LTNAGTDIALLGKDGTHFNDELVKLAKVVVTEEKNVSNKSIDTLLHQIDDEYPILDERQRNKYASYKKNGHTTLVQQ
jgi:hypothetical protein